MSEAIDLGEALKRLLAEREAKAAEVTKLDNAIEAIQIIIGEPLQPTEAAEINLQSIIHTRNIRQESTKFRGPISVRPDQFFGMSHTGAAEAYLKMLGYAAPIEEILETLRNGGIAFSGVDPRKTLYTELVRGTKKFVLVPPQTFGLREFYPNLLKKTHKEAAKKGRSKKKSGWVKVGVSRAKKTPAAESENDETVAGE